MSMNVIYVLIAVAAVAAIICSQFVLAPWRASRRDVKQVSVLGGIAHYIEWERNEVVITTRGGKEWISGEGDGPKKSGGKRFIYDLFGDKLRGRVWLGVQSWVWAGSASTREGIPCSLKIAVKFAVDDVPKYVYENKTAKHRDESREINALSMADDVFKDDTEEIAGSTLSKESLIEMVILKLPKYQSGHRGSVASRAVRSSVAEISEKIVKLMQEKLANEAQAHGMSVVGVGVLSLKFAPEIVGKSLETYLTMFEPLRAEQLAEANRLTSDTQAESYAFQLHLIAKELGIPVTQMRELLQHLPGGSNDTQAELAKAIISEFKNLNAKPETPVKDMQPDALEPPNTLHPTDDEDES